MPATTTTNSQPAATLQVHPPNAKRRQPLAVRMGVHGLQEQQYRRSWTSKISKPLHCLKTFSGEQQQRLKERGKIKLKLPDAPAWKGFQIKSKLFPSPFHFPLIISPERVVGLGLTYALRQIPLSKWKVLNHIISLFSFTSLIVLDLLSQSPQIWEWFFPP